MAEDRVRYERGDLSAEDLKAELAVFFSTAADDAGARGDADAAGINLDQLLAGGLDQVQVEPVDPKFTGVETALLVLLLTPPVQSAWNDVLLPWLKRRHTSPVGDEDPGGPEGGDAEG